MITLSIRSLVCNAAAVFSKSYGAVSRRAEELGCSRQTVYEHARRVERRLQTPESESEPAAVEASAAGAVLDEAIQRRFAVTAFAGGISLRQIEDLLRVILGDDADEAETDVSWPGRSQGRRRVPGVTVVSLMTAPGWRCG